MKLSWPYLWPQNSSAFFHAAVFRLHCLSFLLSFIYPNHPLPRSSLIYLRKFTVFRKAAFLIPKYLLISVSLEAVVRINGKQVQYRHQPRYSLMLEQHRRLRNHRAAMLVVRSTPLQGRQRRGVNGLNRYGEVHRMDKRQRKNCFAEER